MYWVLCLPSIMVPSSASVSPKTPVTPPAPPHLYEASQSTQPYTFALYHDPFVPHSVPEPCRPAQPVPHCSIARLPSSPPPHPVPPTAQLYAPAQSHGHELH